MTPTALASRLAAALVLAVLVACGSFHLIEVQQVDTLYFGTARPGGVVTDAEWKAFVEEVITPRFPGFTEWGATGHWQSEREAAHVVEIIHPDRSENDRRIAEIIEAYKSRFQQQAVFWVREKGLAEAR
jgi:Protein of unknown function (DUF3574)